MQIFYEFQSEGCSEDVINGMRPWFDCLSTDSSVKFLLDLAQKPFPEILLATLKIFKTVSLLPWGLQLIAQEPSMLFTVDIYCLQ